MDAYTYDQDRIDECCVHVIRPGGKAVSFCQFNTLERGPLGNIRGKRLLTITRKKSSPHS